VFQTSRIDLGPAIAKITLIMKAQRARLDQPAKRIRPLNGEH
jgi:hypothetical protein